MTTYGSLKRRWTTTIIVVHFSWQQLGCCCNAATSLLLLLKQLSFSPIWQLLHNICQHHHSIAHCSHIDCCVSNNNHFACLAVALPLIVFCKLLPLSPLFALQQQLLWHNCAIVATCPLPQSQWAYCCLKFLNAIHATAWCTARAAATLPSLNHSH